MKNAGLAKSGRQRQERKERRKGGHQVQAPEKASGGWSFIIIGWLTAACAVALAYEWVIALVQGVHYVYRRGAAGKVYALASEPGAYWASMAVAAVMILILAGASWISFWASKLGK